MDCVIFFCFFEKKRISAQKIASICPCNRHMLLYIQLVEAAMRIVFYLIIILYLLVFPSSSAQAARNAMTVWAQSIVPVLFPYMLFCRLLDQSMRSLRMPKLPIAVLLGMLGGSPGGAAAVSAYGRYLPYHIRLSLSALVGTISPMFLLGTIRSWTSDPELCSKLLLCHWAGAVITAALVLFICPNRQESLQPQRQMPSAVQNEPLLQSIDAILQVGGCIIRYSVLAEILKALLHPYPAIHPFIHAAMEISGGMHAIINSSIAANQQGVLLAAACGFSSFSILSQNHGFLKDTGVGFYPLIALAALRMFVSGTLMHMLS